MLDVQCLCGFNLLVWRASACWTNGLQLHGFVKLASFIEPLVEGVFGLAAVLLVLVASEVTEDLRHGILSPFVVGNYQDEHYSVG